MFGPEPPRLPRSDHARSLVILRRNRGALRPPRADVAPAAPAAEPAPALFGRENLVAWCIVPFDAKKRGPEERAAMLQRLGFKHFAYDWRAEHVPTFDAEVDALKKHGVALDAFWCPAALEQGRRGRSWTCSSGTTIHAAALGHDGRPGAAVQDQAGKVAAAVRGGATASPMRRRRSAAPSACTTTAAGSASRRTKSPSSRPSNGRTSASSTTCTTDTTTSTACRHCSS